MHKIWLLVTHYPTYVWINEVLLRAGPEHPKAHPQDTPEELPDGQEPPEHP